MAVAWVLKPQHRSRVMFQRFMPWWNAQKRKELAEKKEAEKRKKEEEKIQQEKILKELQEKEAVLLEEQMHQDAEDTKHLNENDDLGGKVEDKRPQNEELLNEHKDSGKLQENERDSINCVVVKDLQDEQITVENINTLSTVNKNVGADEKHDCKNQVEFKKVSSDNRRDMTQVHQVVNNQVCVKQDLNQIGIQGMTLNEDDDLKRGMKCNVKKQGEINNEKLNKDGIGQNNIKQNSDEMKHENKKIKCPNDKSINIKNSKDIGKLNNFKKNDIIKTHTGNQSKNKIITVND